MVYTANTQEYRRQQNEAASTPLMRNNNIPSQSSRLPRFPLAQGEDDDAREEDAHSSFHISAGQVNGNNYLGSGAPAVNRDRRPRKSFSGLDHARAVAVAKFRRASDSIKDRIQAISGKTLSSSSSSPSSSSAGGGTATAATAASGSLSSTRPRGLSRPATTSRPELSSSQRLPWRQQQQQQQQRQQRQHNPHPHVLGSSPQEESIEDGPLLSAQSNVPRLREHASAQEFHRQPSSGCLASSYPPPPQHGGAAARAFAARENQRLQHAAYHPRTLVRRDSNICLPDVSRDGESGIDVLTGFLHGASSTERRAGSNGVSGVDPFASIPTELLVQIVSHLDVSSVLTASRVSKRWHEAANTSEIWRGIFLSHYGPKKRQAKCLPRPVGGAGLGKSVRGPQQWKKMYKVRKELGSNWKNGTATAIYLSGHTDSVYCVQFDEDKIITGSRDQTIRVWDMHTFKCRKVIGGAHVIHADRRELGAFHEPPAVAAGLKVQRLPQAAVDPAIYHIPKYYHTASILCLQYDDEIMVTGSSDNTLIKWDIKTFEPIQPLQRHSAGVLDIAFDERKIVSCSKDTTVCIWDRETGVLLQQLSGHGGPVNAVQLRGDLVVSASGEGAARLWNLNMHANGSASNGASRSGPVVDAKKVKEFWSQDRGLACIEFSHDAQFVLAGGNDQSIYKFDTQSGRRVAELTGHTSLVRSLYLDGANGRIISGSYDMSLRVWDYATGESMVHFPDLTTSWMLSAKSDYRRILSTSQDGRTLMLDFGLDVEDVNLLEG